MPQNLLDQLLGQNFTEGAASVPESRAAPLPIPIPESQAAPLSDLEVILQSIIPQTAKPLNKKQKVVGGLQDAIKGFLATKYGGPTGPSSVERFRARNQQEADRVNQANLRKAQISLGERAFKRGEQSKIDAEDRARKDRLADADTAILDQAKRGGVHFEGMDRDQALVALGQIDRKTGDNLELRRLQDALAQIPGALEEGEDVTRMTRAAVLTRLNETLTEGKTKGELKELDIVRRAGEGMLVGFIYGDEQAGFPTLQERLKAPGANPEHIIAEFRARVKTIPGLSPHDQTILEGDLRRTIDDFQKIGLGGSTRELPSVLESRGGFGFDPTGGLASTGSQTVSDFLNFISLGAPTRQHGALMPRPFDARSEPLKPQRIEDPLGG